MDNTPTRQVLQVLDWGPHHQERHAPADTPFAVTGRRIYVTGDIDGRFRPRSNAYDLHAFGRPRPEDPLAYRLQGVWAQPVKGLSGYGYRILVDGVPWDLRDADRFTQAYAWVAFDFRREGLRATRRDFAAQDAPVLFSTLSIQNHGEQPMDLRVIFWVQFDLRDAWFALPEGEYRSGQAESTLDGRLVARSVHLPDQWAAVAGGDRAPDGIGWQAFKPGADSLGFDLPGSNSGRVGILVYHLRLAPGETDELAFGMAVELELGTAGAAGLLDRSLPRWKVTLAERVHEYAQLLEDGPRLVTPDPALDAAFDLARANLRILAAESPALGRYCYAGLDLFPFWFSNDGAYSLVGMLAGGLRDEALNGVRVGLRYFDRGRVPHQISPSGRVAFPGNAQETPLWVMCAWDAYRWTGDRDFLAEVYPGALEGMFGHVLGTCDPDGDGYPSGPGMVETGGMGAETLDSAVYTWAALRALARMAETLGDSVQTRRASERAGQIAERFDRDWWDVAGGAYAMSLDDGNRQHPAPHWAVITPLEVGLSAPVRAAQTFRTVRSSYLNRWGMKHTVGADERVWTLPTAVLSHAAYRYGAHDFGFEMLKRVAETLQHGSIGLFHELIPEGACFIQLWSAAAFLRGVIEDLLGIEVDSPDRPLRVHPRLPEGWDNVEIHNLVIGERRVDVTVRAGRVQVGERRSRKLRSRKQR